MGRFPWDSHRNGIPMDKPRVVHGTYSSVPFPSHSNLCLSHPMGRFPWDSHGQACKIAAERVVSADAKQKWRPASLNHGFALPPHSRSRLPFQTRRTWVEWLARVTLWVAIRTYSLPGKALGNQARWGLLFEHQWWNHWNHMDSLYKITKAKYNKKCIIDTCCC